MNDSNFISPRSADLPAGTMVGEFRILERIGEGGFGIVYRARQDPESTNRLVALKMIRQPIRHAADEKAAERAIADEAAKLARVAHNNIVQFIARGWFRSSADARALPYLVTSWVDGTPISAASRGRSVREKVQLFLGVCDAIAAAHRVDVVHLDLKPANILVRAGERPQPIVLDFGIAQIVDNPVAFVHGACTRIYGSPEQLDGQRGMPGFRSDVHALGVVLFEMLTDRLPYRFRAAAPTTMDEIVAAILAEERRSLREFGAEFDAKLAGILTRAVACRPERRTNSVGKLAAELTAWLELPARKKADTPTQRPSSAEVKISAGAGSFVAAGDQFNRFAGGVPAPPAKAKRKKA